MLSIYLRRGEHRLLMRGCLEEASFFFFLFVLFGIRLLSWRGGIGGSVRGGVDIGVKGFLEEEIQSESGLEGLLNGCGGSWW